MSSVGQTVLMSFDMSTRKNAANGAMRPISGELGRGTSMMSWTGSFGARPESRNRRGIARCCSDKSRGRCGSLTENHHHLIRRSCERKEAAKVRHDVLTQRTTVTKVGRQAALLQGRSGKPNRGMHPMKQMIHPFTTTTVRFQKVG